MKTEPRTIEASGSRYEIGWKIGRHCADFIHDDVKNAYPEGVSPEKVRNFLKQSWIEIEQGFPALAEEYRGMADGAGIPLRDLMASVTEELLDLGDETTANKGCTDIIATHPATAPGVRGLLGHNNDSDPSYGRKTVLVYLAPNDGPESISVGFSGASPMIGLNSYGLAVGGNMMTQTDEKPGVPRVTLTRAALDCKSIKDAQKILRDKNRASSYNVTLLDAEGTALDLEGSATDMGKFGPGMDGLIWHTNHYMHSKMKEYEGRGPDDMPWTVARDRRAKELLKKYSGQIDLEIVKTILRDHADSSVGSICCHMKDVETVFSVILDPSEKVLWLAMGNPCRSEYKRHKV